MKRHAAKALYHPFQNLDSLLKRKGIHLPAEAVILPPMEQATDETPEQAACLFAEAMADVTPLKFNRRCRISKARVNKKDVHVGSEIWSVKLLQRLIESGEGFTVDQTSGYMEAAGPGICPQVTRRLHQGHYAVQDYVDLHGLNVYEAGQVLHAFIQKAMANGRRMVLIVHGRGLTSPAEPVLKKKVYFWLTQGPLRKHVIAFTSARKCDGGTGATYVLLRREPWTKRLRRNKPRIPFVPPCS